MTSVTIRNEFVAGDDSFVSDFVSSGSLEFVFLGAAVAVPVPAAAPVGDGDDGDVDGGDDGGDAGLTVEHCVDDDVSLTRPGLELC